MTISLAELPQQSTFANSTHSKYQESEESNTFIKKMFTNTKIKNNINYSLNGCASIVSLFSFISENFNLLENVQETLNYLSENLSKIAFCGVSFVGAVDLWQKKNILPFVGYALALPTTIFSSGYDLWLSMGVSSGLSNFIVITDQREVVDDKGNPILNENGQTQRINGDFSKRGWLNGLETTGKECLKMIKELFTKPKNIKKISHATFVSSTFEILGSLLGFLGIKDIGAFIRNTATVCAEGSMMLHKDTKSNQDQKNFIDIKSPIAQSGTLWIMTSLTDLLKRFNFITEKISNLTNLSLFFDRLASIRFTQGVLNIKKDI